MDVTDSCASSVALSGASPSSKGFESKRHLKRRKRYKHQSLSSGLDYESESNDDYDASYLLPDLPTDLKTRISLALDAGRRFISNTSSD